VSKSSKLILQWFVTIVVTRKLATPSHRYGWDDSCCLEQTLSEGVEGNPTQCMKKGPGHCSVVTGCLPQNVQNYSIF